MTGIEKVTGKIIADAREEADAILQRADETCAAVRAEYSARIQAERDKLEEQANRECESIITRAKSSAAMAKRNVVLESRAALISEAYATAEKELRELPVDEYLDLLVKMLRGALLRQLESERESLALYGENITPDKYEVLLNRNDRDMFGTRLMETIKRTQVGKISMSVLDRVVLSNQIAKIDGGLVLRCGDVEANCALGMMMAQVRRATEVKVNQTLFGNT
ncbi:MAG: V-type ATP synthase subunit E [Clostridia bacterium]|nr:V-type ATP synthase subunit E [Clostridia bacterium]